jgi:MATE family multidrug resistance protein
MQSSISYKQIFQISLPLIIASLGHSLIGATDTFFLGRSGNTTYLAAIGLIAPLYLTITLVGLALSRGGQIMIARRLGDGELSKVGLIARNMFYFEMALAIFFFIVIYYFGYYLLAAFIDSPELLQISLEYLEYRVLGVFFGCTGVVFISLYTGVARTSIIIQSSAVIAIVNIILNYGLIFGNLGMPEMGMNGAGLASSIAEGFGVLAFIIFAFFDKQSKEYQLFKRSNIDFDEIRKQLRLSAPIALQSFLGVVAWVVFFGLIENLGEIPMAVSSVMRVIYLFIGAIAWGVGSGTNTIISMLIGQGKQNEVLPTLHRITLFTVIFTAISASILLFIPEALVQLITDEPNIINGSVDMMGMVFIILVNLAIYNIYYNGIVGTGDIKHGLMITITSVIIYMIYVSMVVNVFKLDLYWAWGAEIVYGVVALVMSLYYLKRAKWKKLTV